VCRTIPYKRKSGLGSKHSKEDECRGKNKVGNIPDVKYNYTKAGLSNES